MVKQRWLVLRSVVSQPFDGWFNFGIIPSDSIHHLVWKRENFWLSFCYVVVVVVVVVTPKSSSSSVETCLSLTGRSSLSLMLSNQQQTRSYLSYSRRLAYLYLVKCAILCSCESDRFHQASNLKYRSICHRFSFLWNSSLSFRPAPKAARRDHLLLQVSAG